jgi:spore germination cell wall hydrolase CwlJ-like protein
MPGQSDDCNDLKIYNDLILLNRLELIEPDIIQTVGYVVHENNPNPNKKTEQNKKEIPKEKSYWCNWGEFSLNEKEFKLLCRTTYCEGGNQSSNTQTLIALTILNRVKSDIFPNNIYDVIYQENQYSVTKWSDFDKYEWTALTESAVINALNENNYPRNLYYFRTKHFHYFGISYMQADDLYFSTEN